MANMAKRGKIAGQGGTAIPARQGDEIRDASQLPGWTVEQLDYPTFRVGLVAKVMDRLTIRQLAELGDLVYAEWRVLARLAAMPDGGTVRQVAELAWVDRAEVSRAAGALERKGLTTRRDNPQDGRMPILFLTEEGRTRYHAMVRWRSAFHESLLSELSPQDRATLDDLLGRIGGRLMDLLGRTGSEQGRQ
ncbi:MAG: winged helix-turn-helix transcriptional regulator [Sphingomonas sp.]|nr:winged helix-turn-helix transcriptional regulator [Sphingomonas sp.]